MQKHFVRTIVWGCTQNLHWQPDYNFAILKRWSLIMLHLKLTTIGAMVLEKKCLKMFKICYFQTYELEQNNASKQNVGH